ncbi:3-dehydroquinate dehydratase, type II [Luminiphilus syltensis NOR5-1B]|uniref:3-dehydroquinate dehydratase n=1 Tax=Luminiphilus syltensis NOR5-1B TaxID=565045 RepID=B8KW04_9GAMM|nr:type II 3-dehydroquinate dehydratase [Luminiphilus syltensis]EED35942.1 3-dehydroquinate dehydratase, type II [Luminiphilus syltensis NOR5-1B]
MADVLLIHGPNLNLLGSREPEIYGHENLDDINRRLVDRATTAGCELTAVQSNAEHELIEAVHTARDDGVRFIIINPGAFTHTSIALRDALAGVDIPFMEIHISNVHARESFRQHSYFSDIAVGVICGLGTFGYDCALEAVLNHLANQSMDE